MLRRPAAFISGESGHQGEDGRPTVTLSPGLAASAWAWALTVERNLRFTLILPLFFTKRDWRTRKSDCVCGQGWSKPRI